MSDPVFPGVHALLTLVRALYRRPRYFERDENLRVRGDLPLPIVYLLRRPGTHDFLPHLGKRLNDELTDVPHGFVDAAAGNEHPDAVLPLLHALYDKLRERRSGRYGSIRRFDNYELAHHLTGTELPKHPEAKRDEPIRKRLRAWGLGNRPAVPEEATAGADSRLQTVVALVKLAGYLIGFYWGRDRVPGLFRERRWFMRQPYMVPRHSPGFLAFAERLTMGRHEKENQDQLHKLLVHALLEDLRTAYHRKRLGFLPRRPGWRRTAYVTVLLDNVDADGGWELLRLINEVRNETGRLDPLLIIAAADDTPPGIPAKTGEKAESTKAEDSFTEWKKRLPQRRQLLAEDARYLFVTLPNPEGATLSERDTEAWEAEPGGPRPAPRLARRGVGETVAAVALVAALIPTSLTAADYWEADCAFAGAVSGGIATEVVRIGGHDQCVGYSDNDGQVFGRNPRLRYAQEMVFAQNEVAERLHDLDQDRPYLSLVYFAALTSNESAPAAEHAVAEELEGLVIRQRQQNTTNSDSEPLLRVVVANGGTGMAAAPDVVRETLLPLIESDPTILGVVGLDRSVTQTEEAIAELGRHGIPVLGTTLTSVGLDDLSPLYFQLVPDNEKQAELVAGYTRQVRATRVTIYHPPVGGANTYVNTLVEEMQERLSGSGVEVDPVPWRHSPNELTSLCDGPADRSDEIAFYAGREVDFGDFLRTVRRECDERRMPRIVADDAVSRFVAHAPGRRSDQLNGTPVSYVAMGGLVVLAGERCVAGEPGSLGDRRSSLDAFCAGYHLLREELATALPPEERPVAPWPGERVGGLYDAAGMFVAAVRDLGSPTPHRSAVAQKFRELDFEGATGTIDFSDSRVADERNLAILSIENIYEVEGPSGIPTCTFMIGVGYSDQPEHPRTGCPVTG